MPRQNRVTPFGEIIATPARGTLLGNRGCLHDAHQQIRRPYQLQRWIICKLQFKERRHIIMTPGHYTELFFLDEVTALAAGHRPCAECSRDRFEMFRSIWAQANPEAATNPRPAATLIDTALHQERIDAHAHKITYHERLSALPDGSFVARSDDHIPWLVLGVQLLAWSPFGYTQRIPRPATDIAVEVLTPRSIARTLAAGYPAAIHPSALESALGDAP